MSTAAEKNVTPVMRQFLSAKEAHQDALLFFRMGDFYELFYNDAVEAAKALDLTLTARNKGAEDEIPMAGVPHHAASQYIQRLLEKGYNVAICEQMADPSKVKGIVPREVVRVVRPGIVFDDAGLDARQNHYLVAVERDGAGPFGVAALDLSTGELSACEAPEAAGALAELVRLDGREVLAGPGTEGVAEGLRTARPAAVLRDMQSAKMDDASAETTLDKVLGVGEAQASCPSAVARRAAARCLSLARTCEAGRELPVRRLGFYELGDTLLLDEATQAHLELVRTMAGDEKGALLPLLDETKTAGGARLLRRRLLSPRTQVAEIRRRHDGVEAFVVSPTVRAALREALDGVADLERLAVKFTMDRVAPRDFAGLRRSLQELPRIHAALENFSEARVREVFGVEEGAPWVDLCSELAELLGRAIVDDPPARLSDGNVIREGFDRELDDVRAMTKDGQRFLLELEGRLREEAQIPSLKLRYTRVFGWYIEVTKSHVGKAPAAWRRKQTVATGERYTCDELDALADKLAHAEERFASRESELVASLVKDVARLDTRLHDVAQRLAMLDVTSALAEVAHRYDYVRPVVDESHVLCIEDGRHPVVERLAAAGRFVPNDVALDAVPNAAPNPAHDVVQNAGPKAGKEGAQSRLWLVTGPNMAGKSTLMRQVALSVILAQMGAFVPAKKAHIGVVDRVLTRVGASDNLARGESTFMVEMKETALVLRRATRRSLVVLDEIGRGTSTYDGLAIAWAVAEYLHDAIGCRALFATHYHELTELAATRSGLANYSVSAREHEGDIVFLHKLQPGAASRSYGVACARLAGLPELVLSRARVILGELEKGAALPSGAPSNLRARGRNGKAQLDLFGPPPEEVVAAESHPALETLKAVEVDRLTPLEALQLVATLKKLATEAKDGVPGAARRSS